MPSSNAAKTRNPLKLGFPKLANRSQPLVGRTSPYCEDMWKRYFYLRSFFSDCQYVPQLRRYGPTKLCDGAQMAYFWRFLRPAFPASRVQHVSDLHPKLALGPHMCGSMADIQCATAENRRGKKIDRKKKKKPKDEI